MSKRSWVLGEEMACLSFSLSGTSNQARLSVKIGTSAPELMREWIWNTQNCLTTPFPFPQHCFPPFFYSFSGMGVWICLEHTVQRKCLFTLRRRHKFDYLRLCVVHCVCEHSLSLLFTSYKQQRKLERNHTHISKPKHNFLFCVPPPNWMSFRLRLSLVHRCEVSILDNNGEGKVKVYF